MRARQFLVCAMLLNWAWCPAARAELGGGIGTSQVAPSPANAQRRVLSAENYTVHEYQLASGTQVREYLSSSGSVFAVAWNGPFMPNLQELLGSYFGQYRQALETARGGLGPVMIQRPGLVVHSEGHMRAFSGKAYLPEFLPKNLSAEEIR